MPDYTDLIKTLRTAADIHTALSFVFPNAEGNTTAKLLTDAADAIEELSKKLVTLNSRGS